jgi:hypothetical protein
VARRTQKQPPPSIPPESALARLARRLMVIQGISTNPPPEVLPLILDALETDGRSPLDARILGERKAMQTIRRIVVGVLLDDAPPVYQRPRSTRTLDWVKERLPTLSPLLPRVSDDTLQKDIEDWAYNRETGRRRRRRQARAIKPPR